MPFGSARSCNPKFNDRKLSRPWLFELCCGYLRLTASLLCLSSPSPALSIGEVKWCSRPDEEGCFCGAEYKWECNRTLLLIRVFLDGPLRVRLDITVRRWEAPIGPCSLKHLPCYISLWISHGGGLRKEQGQWRKWVEEKMVGSRGIGKDRWSERLRGRQNEWVARRAALLTWQKKVHPLPFTKPFCVLIRKGNTAVSLCHSLPGQCPWSSFGMWPKTTWSHPFRCWQIKNLNRSQAAALDSPRIPVYSTWHARGLQTFALWVEMTAD